MLHYTLNMTITISTCISHWTQIYNVLVMEQLVDGIRRQEEAARREQNNKSMDRGYEDRSRHIRYPTLSDRRVTLQASRLGRTH